MSLVNAVPTVVSEGIQPRTPLEKFKEQFKNTSAIVQDELRGESEDQSDYEADQRILNSFLLKEAELSHQLSNEKASPSRSKKREERLVADIEALKAERAAYRKQRDSDRRNKPGHAMRRLRDFFASSAVHKPYKPANTTDEALPGMTAPEMVAMYREQYYAARKERDAITKAPRSADEIRDSIAAGIKQQAALLSKMVTRVDVNHDKGRAGKVSAFGLEFPKLVINDGIGGLTYIPDALGVMCTLFAPEMEERITAMILADHDESKALRSDERAHRLAEVNAKLSELQYKAEYWHRVARATGANPGPRIAGENVLAILDLVPAR